MRRIHPLNGQILASAFSQKDPQSAANCGEPPRSRTGIKNNDESFRPATFSA
jgi:hypothetical protein